MLRIFQSTNASDARSYFVQALDKEDYYVDDREIVGHWGGHARDLLGVQGIVTPTAFARLCDNLHPHTGERLTPRTRDDRTVGYDLTFHAPKGVSVLHALTRDDSIVSAMRSAVSETMAEIEANTHTRVRLGNKSEDRHTGNLAWGEFVHFTARPVEGVADPHLHIHCFVFNATFDHTEMRFKAGQFRPVVRDHPYFQAVYHTKLAAKLEDLGYPISRNPDGWDVAGVTRSLVEKFSRRTAEIEAAASRLGITDPIAKAELGARTRAPKGAPATTGDLVTEWTQRMDTQDRAWLDWIAQKPGGASHPSGHGSPDGHGPGHAPRTRNQPKTITPEQALAHAIEHTYARKSVESERRLIAEALKFGVGDVQAPQIRGLITANKDLLTKSEDGETFVTTREVLQEEQAVLRFAVEGRGSVVPLGAGYGGHPGEKYEIGSLSAKSGVELNGPQRAAVEHLLSSRDRVMLLRGGAGTGKTTTLMESAAAIQHGGTRVFACAVTTDASRGVLREAGFAKAETLQKLLTDTKLQEEVRGQVIWVDEAGMVGTRTMRKLFELAEKQDARVVLSGDTKQHAPVERGDAMRLLEKQAGIRPAEVDEILRQQGTYKEAVQAMERGDLTESVKLLDEMGSITEIQDAERHEKLASKYLDTVQAKKSALVVSPTHAEGRAVTGLIREQLKESGRIERDDTTITRLQDTQWTDAQKADPHRYEVGQVVQFTQHVRGVPARDLPPTPAGLKATVVAVDADKGLITTEDAAGHRRPLDLKHADRFGVFTQESLPLAAGDTIRITKNARTIDGKRLTNGAHYTVKGFTENGHIQLDNKSKWVISRDMGHFNHGYCVTPQAAQGKSVDVCLAAVSAASLSASSLEQLYVILSRGKQSVELMTDRRSALIDAVARRAKQTSATELLSEKSDDANTKTSMLEHAREVTRLKNFEQERRLRNWQMARGRSPSERDQTRDRAPARTRTQDRTRPTPRGRDAPGRER